MKKNYMITKSFVILLTAGILSSCMSELEEPIQEEAVVEAAIEEGGENLRKGGFTPYEEAFVNQIVPDPINGILYLPGTGEGKAQGMGKVKSFINQIQTSETESVGASVTMFHADALAELGIADIPEEAHSVTVSDNGTAIFYSSGLITGGQPNVMGEVAFSAEVTILGGTKKFRNATGTGTLSGTYSIISGIGTSKVEALIKLN